MNERDSEQVAHSLAARGYERVGHESEADVVLLNTCSVRDMADQKALGKMGMLGRLAKARPHVVFGFLGCMAQTRGVGRSRSINDIVSEVRDLVSRGVKEVTLLGQIVNLYGRHEFPKIDNKSPFVQLLEAVHEIDGLERLRFTSPHPIGFRDDLIDAF